MPDKCLPQTVDMYIALCFFLLVLVSPAAAQDTIAGQINVYTSVMAIDYCTGKIEIADTSGFAAGMSALLIQMQGATIDESNSTSFGMVADWGSAGLFERIYIDSVGVNAVWSANELLHTYQPDGGSVQLVSWPEWEGHVVVADTLYGAPWNGQTGGVLVLDVRGLLELRAPIDLHARGFRGGPKIAEPSQCQWFLQQNDWYYPMGSWRGAPKGEGIARWVEGKEAGRGPQANGGGGGNDHNAGGGGGAQLNAAGQGGEEVPPSPFGCYGPFPGKGGRPLYEAPGLRLFMGGGGGAGHTEYFLASNAGGRGGGILLLRADSLKTNGFGLSANGESLPIANGESGGGGGGGGTIWLDLTQPLDTVWLTAQGGHGGSVDNQTGRCAGPGGGGSGGRVLISDVSWIQADTLTIAVAADSLNGAAFRCVVASPCFEAIASDSASLFLVEPPELTTSWQLVSDQVVAFFAQGNAIDSLWWDFGDGSTSTSYQPVHTFPTVDSFLVLLAAANSCGSTDTAFWVFTSGVPQADFSWQPSEGCAPMQVHFFDMSQGAIESWSWLFPGGEPAQSTDPNPIVTYTVPGTWPVSLEVGNAAGSHLVEVAQAVQVWPQPVASFSWQLDGLVLKVVATGEASTFAWDFGDGTALVFGDSLMHSYAQSGLYYVTLIASNAGCAALQTQPIQIFPPVATQAPDVQPCRLLVDPDGITVCWVCKHTAEVAIFDVLGRMILPFTRLSANEVLSLPSELQGTYWAVWRYKDTWHAQPLWISH